MSVGSPRIPKNGGPKKAAFLAAFRKLGCITYAARAAGCSPTTHRNVWMKQAGYREEFARARAEATEVLELEAWRRAMRGSERPVFHRGRQCGVSRVYSDSMLIFLLKAASPEKYRDLG